MCSSPAIRVRSNNGYVMITSNRLAAPYFKGFEGVRVSITPDYVAFTPTTQFGGNRLWFRDGFAEFSASVLMNRVPVWYISALQERQKPCVQAQRKGGSVMATAAFIRFVWLVFCIFVIGSLIIIGFDWYASAVAEANARTRKRIERERYEYKLERLAGQLNMTEDEWR